VALPDEREQPLRVAGYEIHERVGAGGFGEVFRARHIKLGRDVAIKVLHAKFSSDAETSARFIAEAKAVTRISHPSIVTLFEFGHLPDGRDYSVMEFVRGKTLREILHERGRIPMAEALPILRGIAEAVDAAHAVGIAHRDLKPDNVFLTEDNGIKLIDFGLAKLTRDRDVSVTETGAVFGTPLYMSPEQCRGKSVTLATDAYSFGALAYHLLTGEPPFAGDALELALHHLNDTPERPSARCRELDGYIDQTLLALLAKDPKLRPLPLARAVDALAERRFTRSRFSRRLAIALGVVLLVGGTAAVVMSQGPDTKSFTFRERVARVNFIGIGQWAELDPKGTSLRYKDHSGVWSLDLSTSVITRAADDPVKLPDGRTLTDAVRSPDGSAVAAFTSPDTLTVFDFVRGRALEIPASDKGARVSWSPSSKQLLWTGGVSERTKHDGKVHVLSLSDGVARELPFSVRTGNSATRSAAFVNDDHFIYCSDEGARTSLRVFSERDHRDALVRVLDGSITKCQLTSTKGRVSVLVERAPTTLGLLDLSQPRPEMTFPAATRDGFNPTTLTPDGSVVYLFEGGTPWILNDKNPNLAPGRTKIGPLYSVATRTGEVQQVPLCDGSERIIIDNDKLYAVDLRNEGLQVLLRFRAFDSCATVAEWSLDPKFRWGGIRCGRTICGIAGMSDDRLEVWRLEKGGATSRIASKRIDPTKGESPRFAFSPDERWIVAQQGQFLPPLLAPMRGGDFVEVPVRDASTMSISWGNDPTHFLVTTQTEQEFGVRRIGVDGTNETVWLSNSVYVGTITAARDSNIIALGARVFDQEVLILDHDN
jgi:hypothetical protein